MALPDLFYLEKPMNKANPITALLRSRKFLLTLFAIIQTTVLHLIPTIPPELWQAIDALIAVLITMIAVEDAAAKRAGS